MAFGRFFAALGEQIAHLPFRFAQPHVQDLGAFDGEEKLGMVLAGLVPDLEAQIVSRGLAEERLAATGRAVKQEALRDGMIEALEEFGVQEGQLDGIADALHGLLLAADLAPGDGLDFRERAVNALGLANHLDGHALVDVQPDFVALLELFLAQERGAGHDKIGDARLVADAQAVVGQQFGDLHDRAAAVEAKSVRHGERLVEQHASAGFQRHFGDGGIEAADVIRAVDTNQRAGLGELLQQRAQAQGGRAQLVHRVAEFFDGDAGLVLGFLHFGHALAQHRDVRWHGALHDQPVSHEVDDLQCGEFPKIFLRHQRVHRRTAGGWRRVAGGLGFPFAGLVHTHILPLHRKSGKLVELKSAGLAPGQNQVWDCPAGLGMESGEQGAGESKFGV